MPTSTTDTSVGEKSILAAEEQQKKDLSSLFTLEDLRALSFHSNGELTNCDDAEDAAFVQFLRPYVSMKEEFWLLPWTLEDRRDILNFIFSGGGPKPTFILHEDQKGDTEDATSNSNDAPGEHVNPSSPSDPPRRSQPDRRGLPEEAGDLLTQGGEDVEEAGRGNGG